VTASSNDLVTTLQSVGNQANQSGGDGGWLMQVWNNLSVKANNQ